MEQQTIAKPTKKWSVLKIILGALILLSYLNRLLHGEILFKSSGGSENLGYNVGTILLIILAIWLIISGIRSRLHQDSSSKV